MMQQQRIRLLTTSWPLGPSAASSGTPRSAALPQRTSMKVVGRIGVCLLQDAIRTPSQDAGRWQICPAGQVVADFVAAGSLATATRLR